MKTFLQVLTFYAALLVTCLCSAQNILIADNNSGAVAVPGSVFTGATALPDAIAAASTGDIIQVIRSSTNYGTATVDKPLNIFGIGLNPDTDGGTRSQVTTLNISDPVSSGSRISGMHITSALNLGGVAGALNNLLIENSRIRSIQQTSATTTLNNIIIRGCILGSGIGNTTDETIDFLTGATTNVVVTNNVIYGSTAATCCWVINEGSITADAITLENNLFVHQPNLGTPRFTFEVLTNSLVRNNIFIGSSPQAHTTLSNNTFENNLSFNTLSDIFSTGSGNTSTNNIEAQDPLLISVPVTTGTGTMTTFNPYLDVGSPAMNAGTDNTDIGVSGGAIPYTLEGTLIPLIQSLTVPSMVIEGNTLDVRVKAKGN